MTTLSNKDNINIGNLNPVSLRNHTHYSLLRALPDMSTLVKKSKELGYDACAISDSNNMYGAIELIKICKKENLKPIIGTELKIKSNNQFYDLVLIPYNYLGYKNLMRLVSIANTKDSKNKIPHLLWSDFHKDGDEVAYDKNSPIHEEFHNLNEGLIALSGGPWGEISVPLAVNNFKKAEEIYNNYQKYFPDNFYLEITNHTYMDRGNDIRRNTINFATEYHDKLNAKLVATLNTHYISINDKPAHKVFLQVDSEIDSEELYKNYFAQADFSLLNKEEFIVAFSDIPEALINTEKIKNQIDFEVELNNWVFPNIECNYKDNYNDELRYLSYEGLKLRNMEATEEVIKRLDYELEVIKNKGYSPYFLVVYDLLRYSRENKILTNIRGSVAGSLVTYLLRITKCDPFEYKLPFERFLNPERPSAPDIDMDYADDRRDDVINYARHKYGSDHVGQIGTFGTMLARGAVRDVARSMNFPYIVGDKISRLIPPPKQGFPITIDIALEEIPELKEMYDTDRDATIIIDMAKQVEGKIRHIGVHAAGTLISPRAITDWTPVQYDPKGEGKLISQYDMYQIEDAGLLKFDFLGIRNLSILATAINIVKDKYNLDVDIEEIALDDKKTFEMLAAGSTMGLFQLNGSGMTRFLKELKPTSIHDINAMVALYRPGPLEMIPEYIKRKHNPELIEYLDARLEPILDQSFGVIVYQDDVMLIAIHLAGYSWLEADKLRKAMGKKIPAEMNEQKEKLFKGFKANGLSDKKIQELWQRIEPFAAYGFNKAHAASYGRVAYQTAYMKANFPEAYMTAIMTNESGDIEKVAEIVAECQKLNINVLPPDINYSNGGFEIVKNKDTDKEEIRFGLYTIKNFGKDIADAIIEERNKNGKFTSFENFLTRIHHKNLNKKSIEALAMSGALDELSERNSIILNMDAILDHHKSVIKDNAEQDSLFGSIEAPRFMLKSVPAATPEEKLAWEKNLLGLYVSGFPLDKWKDRIVSTNVNISRIQHEYPDEFETAFACIIEKIKVTKTKKGDKMALLNVRDYTSSFEVAVFPRSYEKLKDKIAIDKPLILKGKVASRNDEKTFVLDEIKELI